MKAVLFICFGNACRSILAEALTRHYWGSSLEVASAGLCPLGSIPAETKKVLQEIAVSIRGLRSKGIAEVDIARFDLIVNLTSQLLPEEVLHENPQKLVINWRVRDPYMESLASFRQARDTIEWLVLEKLPLWLGIR
ncbi:MAG: low molecular weight phosphatase family protein [Deltaproteobacteria bacterium]|nr:low molecular weight phosphatase family protein [Deltaproteobacteria bacterium]MBW2070716.1 low molecular weight phosphatase family protein [Deltaproteobacteria bacterium]